MEDGSKQGGQSKAMTVGLAITAVFVLLQVGCCILCEAVLKQEKNTPFYVQKFFLEVPGSILGLLITNVFNPMVYQALISEPFNFDPNDANDAKALRSIKGKNAEKWEHILAPFAGWNLVVVVAFLFFNAKSWCSGFMTKQLSSIVKQLCSVCGVAILYFLAKIHPPAGPFWQPEGLRTIDRAMVIADFCVLCSVVSYTLAGRDKRRKEQFKKDAEAVRDQLNALTM